MVYKTSTQLTYTCVFSRWGTGLCEEEALHIDFNQNFCITPICLHNITYACEKENAYLFIDLNLVMVAVTVKPGYTIYNIYVCMYAFVCRDGYNKRNSYKWHRFVAVEKLRCCWKASWLLKSFVAVGKNSLFRDPQQGWHNSRDTQGWGQGLSDTWVSW